MLLDTISYYSGFISIILAWGFVILPTLYFKIRITKETVSEFIVKNRKSKRIVDFGLFIGSLFQGLFIVYIIKLFNIDFLSPGIILYLSTVIITPLVAIFNNKIYPRIHRFLVYYYFIFNPISILLISVQIHALSLGLIMIISYISGHYFIFSKYNKPTIINEMFSFLILTIWTMAIYLF